MKYSLFLRTFTNTALFGLLFISSLQAQTVGQWGNCEFLTLATMNAYTPVNGLDCKKAYVQANNRHYRWNGSAWIWENEDIVGDNLGNHTATENIQLDGNWISGDGGNEGIYIDGSGNVGIGISNPQRVFHVGNNIARFSRGGNSAGFIMDRWDTDINTTWASVAFQLDASAAGQGSFYFGNYNENVSGAGYTKWLSFDIDSDQISMNQYGSGTYTGSLSRVLGVESDGDVIEVDATSLGTDDQTASEVNITDSGNNFSSTNVEGALDELSTAIDNIEGDDLGDHTATENIQLDGNWISGDGGNEGIYIDGSGNVGIGISNPQRVFHVGNNIARFSRGGNSAGFIMDRWDTDINTTWASVAFQLDASAAGQGSFYFGNYNENVSGAGYTKWLSFDIDSDQISMNQYGSGTYTGSLSRVLGVESDGDLIEVDASSLGTDDQTASEVSISDSGNNFTATDVEGALAELATATDESIYNSDGSLNGDRSVTQGNFDLNFDSNTFFIDGSANRVGIGTNTPKARLHLNGDLYARGHLYLYAYGGDGNSGTAYIQGRDDSGTSDISMQFRTQNAGSIVNAIRIDQTGDVGIGTTSPDAKLDVDGGTVRFSDYGSGTNNGTATQILGVESDGDVIEVSASSLGTDDQTASEVSISDSGNNFTATDVEGALTELFTTVDNIEGDNLGNHIATENIQLNGEWLSNDGGNEGINVSDDGHIGINTSARADARITASGSNDTPGLYVTGEDNIWFDDGQVRITTHDGHGNWQIKSGSDNDDVKIGDGSGAVKLRVEESGRFYVQTQSGLTNGDNITWNTGLYVNEDGDVGIGNTSPDAKFDVEGGTVRFSDYGDGTYTTGTYNYLLAAQGDGDIVEVDASSLGSFVGTLYSTSGQLLSNRDIDMQDYRLVFNAGNNDFRVNMDGTGEFEINDTGASIFKVLSSGRVGIGVASPTRDFEVGSGRSIRFSDFGNGTYTSGTAGYFLAVQGDGDLMEVDPSTLGSFAGTLYEADGQLADNRTVDMQDYRLIFNAGNNDFRVNMDGTGEFEINDTGASIFKVLSSGRVGIGVASPTRDFEVGSGRSIRFSDFGNGTYTSGTAGYFLAVQGDGDLMEVDPSTLGSFAGTLYEADGQLAENRTVDMQDYALDFDAGTRDFRVNLDDTGEFEVNDSGVAAFKVFHTGRVGIGVNNPTRDFEVGSGRSIRFTDYGSGTHESTFTYLLGAQGDGDIVEIDASSIGSIVGTLYEADGQLAENRTVDMQDYALDFDAGARDFRVNLDSIGEFEVNDSGVAAFKVLHTGRVGIGTGSPARDFEVGAGRSIRFSDYGSGTHENTFTYLLGAQGDGDIVEIDASSIGSIVGTLYEADGQLAANRTVDMQDFALDFDAGNRDFRVNMDGTGEFEINDSGASLLKISSAGRFGIGIDNPTRDFEVGAGRSIRFSDYGDGTYTGTLSRVLGVENDGDLIEVDASTLGTDDQTASEVSITDTGNNFTSTDVEGALAELAAATDENIYTSDGTLDGNRAVTTGNYDLNIDANTLVVDGSANRVGIGTNTPVSPLQIKANGTEANGILNVEGTEPDILFNDTDGGFNTFTYRNAGVNKVAFGRNNNDDFYITRYTTGWDDSAFVLQRSTGNVGIGNTSPISRLTLGNDISHDASFNYSEAQMTIYDSNDNGGNSPNGSRDILHLVREGVSGQAYGNKVSFALSRYENSGTNSRTQLDIKLTDGSFNQHDEVMSLRSDGNVGIGTTSPDAKLDVEGGSIRLSDYGSGTYDDAAPARMLGVQSDGDVVEVAMPTIYSAGKVNGDGSAASIYGATVSRINEGDYQITFSTALSNAHYVIQLSTLDCNGDCPGNGGTRYDDPGITYYDQQTTGFKINVGDSDNGGNVKDDADLEFMFTVIRLP